MLSHWRDSTLKKSHGVIGDSIQGLSLSSRTPFLLATEAAGLTSVNGKSDATDRLVGLVVKASA